MLSRWLHCVAFTSFVIVLGLAVVISPFGLAIERELGLQSLFTMRGPLNSPPAVAVVGINNASGAELGVGRLPRDWPRSIHGRVVERLSERGAPAIVFDMDFSAPKAPEEDLAFADAIEAHGAVVLFERLDGRTERLVGPDGSSRWLWVETAASPTEPLFGAARATAPFPLPKVDDAAHQFWAFKPSADDTPTTVSIAVQLALAHQIDAWREALTSAGAPPEAIPARSEFDRPGGTREYMRAIRKLFLADPQLRARVEAAVEAVDLPDGTKRDLRILAALYGGADERWTNLYGPPGTIPTVDYQDIANADPEAVTGLGALDGRTVFVGYSDLYAPDQPDRFYTVFTDERGIDLSGCEIMATAFANLLEDSALRPLAPLHAIALVAIFGVAVSQIVFWMQAFVAVPLGFALGASYTFLALRAFSEDGLWAPLATPLAVQLPAALLFGLLGQYFLERRQKQRVGAAIAAYLPENIVKDLTAGRLDASKLNDVVHGVCLANDMAGFSAIAERKSPSELAAFMNAYFDVVAASLKSCKVDVTEFHADTIMCAFIGAPDDPDVRHRALRAALSVARAIESYAAATGETRLLARVGLDAGPFYLGHTGGGGRLSYSILGNPANAAARLESLNKTLGTRILASESVVSEIEGFVTRPLGAFKVVGKDEIASVFEVMARDEDGSESTRAVAEGFSAALEAFRSERWDRAKDAFEELAARFPKDGPTAFYRDVCARYLREGPPEGNPTLLAMTSK